MIRVTLIFSILVLYVSTSFGQDMSERPADYPIPEKSETHLFYIQRNRNHHTIIYDAKLNANGKFDGSEPIDVYWLRYYGHGIEKRDLKWIERKFAYGYSSKRDDNKDEFWIELVAFDDRKIHLVKSASQKPLATVRINDTICKLDYIWVYADESGSWPKVIHVDVYGTDLATGKVQKERIKNK